MKYRIGVLTEIAALGQRCNKNRAVRQGMMQQLFTGRLRLVGRRRTGGRHDAYGRL